MNEKLQKIWAKCALTLSRQSGSNAPACAAAALAAVLALPAIAGPIDWAHQKAGAVQSNGAVTVKSLSGGSYSATGNPSGAVAKANQNAVSQPPTVIIQATSGAARECRPQLVQSATMPSCSAGYTSIFQTAATGCSVPGGSTFNIAGTNWSFGGVVVQNAQAVGFMNDNKAEAPGGLPSTGLTTTCQYVSSTYTWSANLCCK